MASYRALCNFWMEGSKLFAVFADNEELGARSPNYLLAPQLVPDLRHVLIRRLQPAFAHHLADLHPVPGVLVLEILRVLVCGLAGDRSEPGATTGDPGARKQAAPVA